MSRRVIKIIRRGKIVEIDDFAPDDTLLDYLRLKERVCGCKEGCGDGDCGACTVVVGELRGGALHYHPDAEPARSRDNCRVPPHGRRLGGFIAGGE